MTIARTRHLCKYRSMAEKTVPEKGRVDISPVIYVILNKAEWRGPRGETGWSAAQQFLRIRT